MQSINYRCYDKKGENMKTIFLLLLASWALILGAIEDDYIWFTDTDGSLFRWENRSRYISFEGEDITDRINADTRNMTMNPLEYRRRQIHITAERLTRIALQRSLINPEWYFAYETGDWDTGYPSIIGHEFVVTGRLAYKSAPNDEAGPLVILYGHNENSFVLFRGRHWMHEILTDVEVGDIVTIAGDMMRTFSRNERLTWREEREFIGNEHEMVVTLFGVIGY